MTRARWQIVAYVYGKRVEGRCFDTARDADDAAVELRRLGCDAVVVDLVACSITDTAASKADRRRFTAEGPTGFGELF